MPTTRTHTQATGGEPVTLEIHAMTCSLVVHAEPGRDAVEVTVSTPEDSGPAADVVHETRFRGSDERIRVDVPAPLTRQTAGVYAAGVVNVGGSVAGVQTNVFNGPIDARGANFGRGAVHNTFTSTGMTSTTTVDARDIEVVARVPERSTLLVNLTAGDVHTTGALDRARIDATAGHAHLDRVGKAHAQIISGGIQIGTLTGGADLDITTGNITIDNCEPAPGMPKVPVRARTMTGNIRVAGPAELDARTMNGSVQSS